MFQFTLWIFGARGSLPTSRTYNRSLDNPADRNNSDEIIFDAFNRFLTKIFGLTDDEFITFLCRICVAATARVPSRMMQFIIGIRHVCSIDDLSIDPQMIYRVLKNISN